MITYISNRILAFWMHIFVYKNRIAIHVSFQTSKNNHEYHHVYIQRYIVYFSYSPSGTEPGLTGQLSTVYQELEAIEADSAPARAGMILAGLGFSTEGQKRHTRWVEVT